MLPLQKKSHGFTLIELLVVIAIIGILASVVLASLNSARNKSKDASIKAQMGEMKKQAALYYLANNSYGAQMSDDDINACRPATGLFSTEQDAIGGMLLSVYGFSSALSGRVICAIGANGDSWAFAVPLFNPTSPNTGWCVDSAGAAKEIAVTFSQNGGAPLESASGARCP